MQPALEKLATDVAQQLQLIVLFDTFGNDLQIQGMGQELADAGDVFGVVVAHRWNSASISGRLAWDRWGGSQVGSDWA